MALFSRQIRYPRYYGKYEDQSGFAIEFEFEAAEPIREVHVMLYGRTGGVNRAFDQLSTSTGWQVEYPPF
jgi:hypothetical protein